MIRSRRQRFGLAALVAAILAFGAAREAVRGDAQTPMLMQNEPKSAAPPAVSSHEVAPNIEPLPVDGATGILGKKVKGPNGEDLGLIVDVIVDAQGRPRAAVIDFGGFLGVGSRKVAVDWQALNFLPSNRTSPIELGLGREAIQAAPEYKPNGPNAMMVGPLAPAPPQVDK